MQTYKQAITAYGGEKLAKSKEQNYLHGAAILTAGVIIMKILGAIYKIPIKNMIGDDGYALFLSAYNVYNVFLVLATTGLPVALSRMISAARTQGRYMQARKIFKVSWWTFFVLGAVSSAIMFFFPEELASIMNNEDAAESIWALSPAVLIVCLTSAYRGFCQGHENMIPTTVGQVLEVLVKVIVGLALAAWLLSRNYSKPIASAGAIFGVTAGAVVALVYMLIYKKINYKPEVIANPDVPGSNGAIFKELIFIAIPIALGSAVLSIVNLLDSIICMDRLQSAAGFTYAESKSLFGAYGAAQTLYNLPAAFITPITISIVPAISVQLTQGHKLEASKISEDAMRISTALCLPMGIGLSVLAYPIINVVYVNTHESAPMLLCLLGVAAFSVCFVLITNAVLQATGNEKYPVYSILVGGIVKIIVDWWLVGIESVNIYGAPISSLCCYTAACVMNFIFVCKSLAKKPSLKTIFARPVAATALMAVVAYGVYEVLGLVLSYGSRMQMALGMLVAIGAAALVYVVAIIKLRAITAEDMKLIPKGEKIAKLLHMS